MTGAANQPAMERKRCRKRLCQLAWAAVLASVLGVSANIAIAKQRAEQQGVRADIQKRLDAIRAAGEPVTAADLARLYPNPPPERDARRMLNSGLLTLTFPMEVTNLPFFSGDALPSRLAPLEESVTTEAQQWLDRNRAALASIPWDELPGSWISSGFTNGLDRLTENPPRVMELVRLLCLDAVVQAERHRPQEAVASLRRALAVGNTFKNDTLVHFMLRASSQIRVCQALERVLNRGPVADADMAVLQAGLTITNMEATREYWANERCLGLFIADTMRTQAQQLAKRTTSPVLMLARAYQARLLYRDDDLLDYLEWNDRCLAALRMPMSNAIPAIAAAGREFDELKSRRVLFLNGFRKRGSLFLLLIKPHLLGFISGEVRCVATVRAAIAAMAVERWRLAHSGRLPESLAVLVPDFLPSAPTDPFDDQPLRYKQRASGYVLYSVGPDFIADGGKEKPANAEDGEHYDITFTVER